MDDHGGEADILVLRRVHPVRFALDPVCVSCTVPEDDPATFAISRSWKVVLHPDQTVPGALLVVSTRHVPRLCHLRHDESVELFGLLGLLERALEQSLGATMANFSCLRNWSFRSRDPIPPLLDGKPNPHVHWHVAPRYRDAVVVAGETFVDEDFGDELRWLGRFPSEAVASELIERLCRSLGIA
jgi:diadenosine tetraphosphate (Ap4A) HIT family hydrolase